MTYCTYYGENIIRHSTLAIRYRTLILNFVALGSTINALANAPPQALGTQ